MAVYYTQGAQDAKPNNHVVAEVAQIVIEQLGQDNRCLNLKGKGA